MSATDDKDTRTLPPTAKRVQDFRKRGEIALSKDLVAAATLVGALVGVLTVSSSSAEKLRDFVRFDFEHLHDASARALVAQRGLASLLAICAPVAGGALAGCLIAMALELGWPPALLGLKFDLTKPFSFGGLGGLVSPKAAVWRTLQSTLKVAFVGGAAAIALSHAWVRVAESPTPEPTALAELLVDLGRSMLLTAGGALVLLAVLDYMRARRTTAQKMKMTPAEMKREHRESEGDPAVRRRRRQRMRELARRRLSVLVPKADVVLVNPTEYAVALRYNANEEGAPRVLAKGRGAVAERIRELARKAGVPIIAEPPLTRLIHKLVPEGREIPSQLFQAVASVLAYVYRLRGRTA